MNSFTVLHKKENDAIILLPVNDIELADYLQGGYNVEMEGTKRECLNWIEMFWDEEVIPDDQRIFTDKKNA